MSKQIPEMLESFSQLVAAPSVSSTDPQWDQSNRGVVDLLAEWLEGIGFKTEVIPVPADAGSVCTAEKFNLIACLYGGEGEGEGGLVLSGHTDTVPFSADSWHQDPFRLTENEGRIHGLGICDMKSFFPIVLEVVQQLNVRDLKQPLYVLATADEESTMSGARALAGYGRSLGRHALIGEPTGLMPVYMHKGILMESIKIKGQAGHSSNPALGNSALEGMQSVMSAILIWRKELQKQFQDARFFVPEPTINFGTIHGGDNPNRICAECELTIDLRLMPEMELEKIRTALRSLVTETIYGSGLSVEYNSIFDGIPGFQTDINSEVIQIAEKLSGRESGAVAFGTEGPYLNAMGMDTVVLGPGDIDQAHQANEYLSLDRIPPMLDILTKMVSHFCIRAD
ncbi:MAG: acetylornithine deacetylase [Gammaproteobacteria bacterium]|jgi:acetylornithine deacetylase